MPPNRLLCSAFLLSAILLLAASLSYASPAKRQKKMLKHVEAASPPPSGRGLLKTPASPPPYSSEPVLRRLSKSQYANTLIDTFKLTKVPAFSLPSAPRKDGLIALGLSNFPASSIGAKQYKEAASIMAHYIIAHADLSPFLPCPSHSTTYDEACLTAFISAVGGRLFRQPLNGEQLGSYLDLARKGMVTKTVPIKSAVTGVLTLLLQSPYFLYEHSAFAAPSNADPLDGGAYDSYTMAGRLAYLLWDGPPDERLLQLADNDTLQDPSILHRELKRMLADKKFSRGALQFFRDLWQFERLHDPYGPAPGSKSSNSRALVAEMEALITNVIVTENRSIRDLLTYQDAADKKHKKAGLFGKAGMIAILSQGDHKPSPTLRGKALMEMLLCTSVPPPPASSNLLLPAPNPSHTRRQQMQQQVRTPSCRSCHLPMDDLGLAFEPFDTKGRLASTSTKYETEASGEFEGAAFTGHGELMNHIAKSARFTTCLASKLTSYALGYKADALLAAHGNLTGIHQRWQQEGFTFRALLTSIILSPFFRIGSTSDDQEGID